MHDHPHEPGHGPDHDHDAHPVAGPGHNRPKAAAQWQVAHRPEGADDPTPPAERDLDLVETSFVEGFVRTGDPTSFLRLANIPFVGVDGAGRRLHLLRVETETLTDVSAVAPLLGGEGFRYDPLPARLVAQRRRLAFVYHDGRGVQRLDFAQARRLIDESAASRFTLAPHA